MEISLICHFSVSVEQFLSFPNYQVIIKNSWEKRIKKKACFNIKILTFMDMGNFSKTSWKFCIMKKCSFFKLCSNTLMCEVKGSSYILKESGSLYTGVKGVLPKRFLPPQCSYPSVGDHSWMSAAT